MSQAPEHKPAPWPFPERKKDGDAEQEKVDKESGKTEQHDSGLPGEAADESKVAV